MPVNPYTEDEMAFLAQLDKMPDGRELDPEQVAIILGVTIDWLKKKQGLRGRRTTVCPTRGWETAPV